MADRSRAGDTTDRERLAAAFAELSARGYLIPFAPWDACCALCGWTEVRRQLDVPDDVEDDSWALGRRSVWWHEQADARAFAGDAGMALHTDEFWQRVPDDEHDVDQWLDDHEAEAQADTMTARVTKYAMLRAPLQINWIGNPDEIAAALRSQGLHVLAPQDDDDCVVVLPDIRSFSVSVVAGEVVLGADDGFLAMISPAMARMLAEELLAAAEEAGGLLSGE